MAPVVRALRGEPNRFRCTLVSTGQHREMLRGALAAFDLAPDVDLDVMRPDQTLAGLSARLYGAVDDALDALRPDWALVQGDTTTVQVAALCSFYRGVRVGHVEAGLRSGDMRAPFPEELNRRVAALVADLHFAPTLGAADNLRAERVDPERIVVTGNTGIDALLLAAAEIRRTPPPLDPEIEAFLARHPGYVLVTGHRRENFGDGFANICRALARLAEAHPKTGFLYPVHLNPRVRDPVRAAIGGRSNVLLAAPQDYPRFVRLMDGAALILTDSGGVQEEAPSLGKPVLVMRTVTERPEGVDAGCAELVGADPARIFDRVSALLTDAAAHARMARVANPYGDGRASARIVAALSAFGARAPARIPIPSPTRNPLLARCA